MMATECPWSSRMCASVEPTRPHPMITMCTVILRLRVGATTRYALMPPVGSAGCAARPPWWAWSPADRHDGGVDPKRAGPAAVGDVLKLAVGEAVHGGWCVARPVGEPGASEFVVFVRHALPAEQVRAVVTQRTARFARADAVEILSASPDRVHPPCPYAKPGGCGGCDRQHASLAAQ